MNSIPALLTMGFTFAMAAAQEPKDKPAPAKAEDGQPVPTTVVTAQSATSPLDFSMPDIDGKGVPLSKYKGHVLLIVNVASKCGLTPQYEQLQELYEKYADRGLRIAAFPANNFKQQEPGINGEIKAFCQNKYGVRFDLYAKVSVRGDDQCELYKFLTSERKDPDHAGEIQWNFTKFLVGRDGKVLGRFEPKVKPDDPQVVSAIEKALAEKLPAATDKPVKPAEPKKP